MKADIMYSFHFYSNFYILLHKKKYSRTQFFMKIFFSDCVWIHFVIKKYIPRFFPIQQRWRTTCVYLISFRLLHHPHCICLYVPSRFNVEYVPPRNKKKTFSSLFSVKENNSEFQMKLFYSSSSSSFLPFFITSLSRKLKTRYTENVMKIICHDFMERGIKNK